MYRKLVQAQETPANSNKYQAAGRLKLRPEAAELALASAHRIPRKRLLNGLSALYEADSQLKSNAKEAEKRIILEFLLTRLTA
jgi:DNA polymerase III delta subunit